MSYAPYPAYKDSGVPWVRDIPSNWETHPFFTMAVPNKQKNLGGQETNLLSLSYGRIIRKDIKDNSGLLPESFDTYQIVDNGHIVFRLTDLQNDKVSLRSALVPERGIITSAYLAVWFKGMNAGFANYLMRSYDKSMVFYEMGGGVRQSGKFEDLKWMPVIVPPIEEQTAIADFLDKKTAEIDDLIAKKEELLRLLAEQRTALITHAVTKGLNPNAPMKPSCIDWLGDVPEGWEVKRLRFALKTNPALSSFTMTDDQVVSFVPMDAVGEYGGIRLDQEKSVKEVGSGYTPFADGDIVVAKITPCFENRKGALATGLTNGVAFGTTELHVLRPHSDLDREFLFYLTISDSFRDIGESEMYGAGGQKRISDRFIKDYRTGIPPLAEQKEIVKFVADAEERFNLTESKISSALEKLQDYRTALITNAVTGKIKVA